MTKVLLLSDGGYGSGLRELEYPVEVLAERIDEDDGLVFVLGSELIRIGGDVESEEDSGGFDPEFSYCFFLDTEAGI